MAINRWRCVRYTDDGCSEYQCLACYKMWEGRNNPEYSQWTFCPYCGSKWEGRLDCLEHREKYWRLPRYNERKPPASYWLIEKRYHIGIEGCEWGNWEHERILDGRYPAREIHRIMRELRSWAKHDHKTYGSQNEYRVKMIDKLPYAGCHVSHYYGGS
jgi:hypothetical protein